MDRLQKKCFIAALGVHSLLFLILLIGPAFVAPQETRPEPMPILDILDAKLIDAAFSGGGNPNGGAAQPAPPKESKPPEAKPPPQQEAPPPPKPQETKPQEIKPQETKVPEPKAPAKVKDPAPDKKRNPDSLEVEGEKKTRTFDFKPTTRQSNQKSARQVAAEKQAREAAEAKSAAAKSLLAAAGKMSVSGATSVEAYGPGGGGEVYMSYDQYVRSVYWRAWEEPLDATSENAVTQVTITIASDGTVTFSRITKRSGDAAMDRSVTRALDRVRTVRPFPSGAKDKERTYTIDFNLKAKRLSG